MAKKIDTFSANSLRILDKSVEEFKNKYIYNLSLFKKDERTILGEKFHSLICAYINDFDVSKMILELDTDKKTVFENLKNILKDKKEKFIKTEFPFLIKDEIEGEFYYLTGRFDAILKDGEDYIIYDWKTLNLPKNPDCDLQTIVYLYCASKIFNTNKIKIRYLSVEQLDFADVCFKNEIEYKNKIEKIILKYYE